MSTPYFHTLTPDGIAAFYAEARELGVALSDGGKREPTGSERPDPRAQQQHEEPKEMRVWRAKQALSPGTPAEVAQRAGEVSASMRGKSPDADLQQRVDRARRAIGASK